MTHSTDYLVIGAGPAGLQVAHLLGCAGRDYLVLEASSAPGAFFTVYPRNRRLISTNKRHTGSTDSEFNLKMDWNSLLSNDPDLVFTQYSDEYFPSADDFTRYLADYAERLQLRVEYDSRVVRVSKDADGFVLTTQDGRVHTGRRVIICSGLVPNVPDFTGIELAEPYATFNTNPTDFTAQRVLIIGSGNSAFETADSLVAHAATIHIAARTPVQLAWNTHFVGHLRAVNNSFLDTYHLKSQNAILDFTVTEIVRREGHLDVTFQYGGGERTLSYDRVIACTGFRFDDTIFAPTCAPELAIDDRFPAQTGSYESINVPGLFFGGTVTQQLDYRRSTSGFIHGFRYGARALTRLLDERDYGTSWPSHDVTARPNELALGILERINRSSGLWQQFGALGDVIVVPVAGPARILEEVPIKHIPQRRFAPSDRVFVATLEYGTQVHTPFTGTSELADATSISSYFHPVIRTVASGVFVDELHLPSDLENNFLHPRKHVARLTEFLAAALATSSAPV